MQRTVFSFLWHPESSICAARFHFVWTFREAVYGVCLQVRIIRLVGMMLVVFVNKVHIDHIREVASESVGTGLMNKMVCLHLLQ